MLLQCILNTILLLTLIIEARLLLYNISENSLRSIKHPVEIM